MADYVFTLRNVRKAHGDKVVLDNVTLSFLHGAKIGVVGPERHGQVDPAQDHGGARARQQRRRDPRPRRDRRHAPAGAAADRGHDRPGERRGGRPRDQGEDRPLRRDLRGRWPTPTPTTTRSLAEMGDLQTDLDHAYAWDLDSRLDQAMDALRCPPPDAIVDTLSGGERRRVALCKLLLQQPDLLLLDEPTNHLDAESVQWLEGHLASLPRLRAGRHPRPVLPGQRRRSGSSSSTGARPTPTRATTRRTSRPRRSASRSRGRRTPSAPRCSSASWSGCGPTPRPGRRRASPVWRATRSWPPRPTATARSTPPRSTSRPVRGWATSCSRPTA